jgi:hypothetical protein
MFFYLEILLFLDMDILPKTTYEKMQRIGEVYMADLGIDINEKDVEVYK